MDLGVFETTCLVLFLVGALQKEISSVKDTKDKQIDELRQLSEQTQQSKQHEYEKKVINYTARIRSTTGGYIFSLFVSSHPGGGYSIWIP